MSLVSLSLSLSPHRHRSLASRSPAIAGEKGTNKPDHKREEPNMIASAAAPERLLRPLIRSGTHPRHRQNPNTFSFPSSPSARNTPIAISRLLLSPLPASPSEIPSSEPLQVPSPEDGLDSDPDSKPDEVEAGDGVEIEVSKMGRNRRRIRARVGVCARMEAVWAVLTDYEGLAGFIPSLAVSRLVEKGEGFAKLYQLPSEIGWHSGPDTGIEVPSQRDPGLLRERS